MGHPQSKYRINVVAAMTGIPSPTLRAWERRYGVPQPDRTRASYRLYSDRDVEMVKRVQELCAGGMAVSQAAKVVLDESALEGIEDAPTQNPYERVRDAVLAAVADFDPPRTKDAVRLAMALGPATAVYDKVLAPAMREIGERWHRGELSVAHEHMASHILEEAATSLLRLVERADASPTIVLACFADEAHTFPSYGVALKLLAWGYAVVNLGARTPPAAIKQAVAQVQPALVALSATTPIPAHRARELVEEYAAACGETPWVVGGSAAHEFAELITSEGGTVLAAEAELKTVVGRRPQHRSGGC